MKLTKWSIDANAENAARRVTPYQDAIRDEAIAGESFVGDRGRAAIAVELPVVTRILTRGHELGGVLAAAVFFLAASVCQGAPRTVTIHNTAAFEKWLAGQRPNDTVLFAGDVGTPAAPAVGEIKVAGVHFDVAPGATPNVLYFLTTRQKVGNDFEARNIVSDFTGAPPMKGAVYTLAGQRNKLINVFVETANVNSWPGPVPPACTISTSPPCQGRQPVLSPTDAGGAVIYGSVLLNGHHGVYVQNVAANGPKLIEANIISRDKGCGSNCARYAIHGYTQGGKVDKLNVFRNIVYGSQTLIGGSTRSVATDNTISGNFFYGDGYAAAHLAIAYTLPSKNNTVEDNTFVNATLLADGVIAGSPDSFLRIRGNKFFGGTQRNFVGRPFDAKKQEVLFGPNDSIDGNTYMMDAAGKIKTQFWLPKTPNGKSQSFSEVTLEQQRKRLAEAGCVGCDASSKAVPAPEAPIVAVYPNQYQANRANLAVATIGATTPHKVDVNLAGAVTPGTNIRIMWAESNPYTGAPRWQGTFDGSAIALPVNGEFEAFVVVPGTASPSPAPSPAATPGSTDATAKPPAPGR